LSPAPQTGIDQVERLATAAAIGLDNAFAYGTAAIALANSRAERA
jgi:hypothetical protein